MRFAVSVLTAAALALGLPLSVPTSASAQPSGGLCTPGAKVQVWYGSSWYEATVIAPRGSGCLVHYEGWSSASDGVVPTSDMRASSRSGGGGASGGSGGSGYGSGGLGQGSGGAVRVGAGVPNGNFACHKVGSNGMLINGGVLQVRGGQGQVVGMPTGWTVTSISKGVINSRGEQIIRVYYRSTSGNSDVLDCVPR